MRPKTTINWITVTSLIRQRIGLQNIADRLGVPYDTLCQACIDKHGISLQDYARLKQ